MLGGVFRGCLLSGLAHCTGSSSLVVESRDVAFRLLIHGLFRNSMTMMRNHKYKRRQTVPGVTRQECNGWSKKGARLIFSKDCNERSRLRPSQLHGQAHT